MSRIMLNDPSLWRTSAEGRPQPEACLNNPALVDHWARLVRRLRDAGFQTVFVDEPTRQDCFCQHCQKRFRQISDRPLQSAPGSAEYAAFQKQTVNQYIECACQRVKETDHRLQTVCCVMPHDRDYWLDAARVAALDMLGTDPYWLVPMLKLTLGQALDDAHTMKQICQQHGKKSQLWLNCWGIPAGAEVGILEGGWQLSQMGFDSFFTWSYRGGLGTVEECGGADAAWQNVVTLYKRLAQLTK